MDAIYPCRTGPNPELRFSLRSLANIVGVDQVWIFGGCPDWVTNINFVPTPQAGNKHRNVNTALRLACQHPDVSDPFILMNDDFYIMQPVLGIPTLNRGTLHSILTPYDTPGIHRPEHIRDMRRTWLYLRNLGHTDPLSFELHVPMVIRKQPMLEALDHGPHQRRTVYAAITGLRGTTTPDVKINRTGQPIPPGPFLSTADRTFPTIHSHLARTFPNPSPHEN